MEQDNTSTTDVLAEVREAIIKMVHARLAVSKALLQVKSENFKGGFDESIEYLENVIEALYGLEIEMGQAHQTLLVSVATEVMV